MFHELSDEELLACEGGSQEGAFEELARRFEARLFYFAMRSLREEGLARDAVQETLLRAWRNKKSFRQGSRLSTWLFAIELNWCRDQLRRRSREKSLEEPGVSFAAELSRFRRREADPSDEAERHELSALVVEALESLPPLQQKLLGFRKQGLDFEEAGRAAGMSPDAARAMASRAYKKLRTWFLQREK